MQSDSAALSPAAACDVKFLDCPEVWARTLSYPSVFLILPTLSVPLPPLSKVSIVDPHHASFSLRSRQDASTYFQHREA